MTTQKSIGGIGTMTANGEVYAIAYQLTLSRQFGKDRGIGSIENLTFDAAMNATTDSVVVLRLNDSQVVQIKITGCNPANGTAEFELVAGWSFLWN
jgi:hypothetical protein